MLGTVVTQQHKIIKYGGTLMYTKLQMEMEQVSYLNWNEFREIDNLRMKRFAKKAIVACAIIVLLVVLQVCTDILNPYVRVQTQIVTFIWISHAYLSNASWRRKYLAELDEWDNAIEEKRFEDVVSGKIKPKVKTPGLTIEIMKLRKSENKNGNSH